MVSLISGVHRRFAGLIAELAKFGVVGVTASAVDLAGAGYLHAAGVGPLSAKAISITIATVLSYVGNRFWTFRHRANHALLREFSVFVLLNAIGLVIAELTIGFTYYVLGFHGPVAFNLASVAGTGLGTIFRYWSYKKWVFIAPEAMTEITSERLTEPALAGAPASRVPAAPASSSRASSSRASRSSSRGSSRGLASGGSPFRSGYAGAHRRTTAPVVADRR
jgi:putative flippase GtrA